jgi:hypothetical protein
MDQPKLMKCIIIAALIIFPSFLQSCSGYGRTSRYFEERGWMKVNRFEPGENTPYKRITYEMGQEERIKQFILNNGIPDYYYTTDLWDVFYGYLSRGIIYHFNTRNGQLIEQFYYSQISSIIPDHVLADFEDTKKAAIEAKEIEVAKEKESRQTKDIVEPVIEIEEKPSVSPKIVQKKNYLLISTGTGFFVSNNGYILTNYHVIDGASEVRITSSAKPLKLIGADNLNDLALLKIDSTEKNSCQFCNFYELGENVIVAGYPYQGILSDSLNITEGIVSGLSGVGNDSRFLQITAPLQPGNSGGPLFNQKGNVVGVVTAKLNALKFIEYTGSIPENVNFALKSSIITNFLQVYNVPFTIINCQKMKEIKTTQIARQSRQFVVLIENWQ